MPAKKPVKRKYNHKRYGNTLPSPKEACFYCGKKLDDYSRTSDHLIPKCDGGILSNDNKVHCCRECNELKANMHPEQFEQALESMIRLLSGSYRKQDGYLKKVRNKVNLMIKKRNTNGKRAVQTNRGKRL